MIFKKQRPRFPISNLVPIFEEDAVLFWWVTWCILVAIPTPCDLAPLFQENAQWREWEIQMFCRFPFTMDRAIHSWVKRKFYFVSALIKYLTLIGAICKFSIKNTWYIKGSIFLVLMETTLNKRNTQITSIPKHLAWETIVVMPSQQEVLRKLDLTLNITVDRLKYLIWIIWLGQKKNPYLTILSPQLPSMLL